MFDFNGHMVDAWVWGLSEASKKHLSANKMMFATTRVFTIDNAPVDLNKNV